jgi:hypothetical protein
VSDSLRSFDGGATQVDQLVISTLGNTHLKPERSSELEGGFDVDLWHDRFSMKLTGYRKTRHDAIISIPVAQSVYGFANILTNIGVVRNTGTEASADAHVIDARQISWSVGMGLSANRNTVVRLNPGQGPVTIPNGIAGNGVSTRIVPGYPLFGYWALPIAGYNDGNHDGIIAPNEILVGDSVVFIGEQVPKYELVLHSDLSLGRFVVSAAAQYKNGMTQFNGSNQGTSSALYDPHASLADQAAAVAQYQGAQVGNADDNAYALTPYGLVQTVNVFRFNS